MYVDCGISIFDARAIVALINSISPHDSQASTRTPSSQGMLVLDMIMQQEEKHQAGMVGTW